MRKKIIPILMSAVVVFSMVGIVNADSTGEVITLGANLKPKQKQEILNYFGVSPDNPDIIYVNNKQERKYLQGIAPDRQIGHVTMSSSYVVPTDKGGINVKTSNITWVTSSMIASTLATAGIENANVVCAAPFPVSGTGALTGIMIAFEKSSGQNLTEEKKKLANKELVTTGNLAQQVGKDKATAIINDSKKKVIKDGIKDNKKIEDTIKQVADKYNVTLNTGDISIIVNLLSGISKQDYNYKDMKDTLNNISSNVAYNLKKAGENIDVDSLVSKAKSFINNNRDAKEFFNKFDDSKLSKNAVVSTTNSGVESAQKLANDLGEKVHKSGLWEKIKNFFKSLFTN